MSLSLILSLSIVFFLPRLEAAEDDGWVHVPNAAEREVPESGWQSFPFEPLSLVDEITGRDFAGADLIADKALLAKVQAREFLTLHLVHLDIRGEDAVVQNDAATNQSWTSIPFAISVHHSRKGTTLVSPVRGALEVTGQIKLFTADSHFEVEVTGFDDATAIEWIARKLGLHREIDLKFARAVVEPVLGGYLNSGHTHAEILLGMLNQPFK